jgi:archaellum biogenesis ATPase FlaH
MTVKTLKIGQIMEYPSFLEIAKPLIARNIPVIPVEPWDKACFLDKWQMNATTDINQIIEWNKDNPLYNVGCVGKPDHQVMLDCDMAGLVERIERETGMQIPSTYTVKSGGKGMPHYYFLQTDRSRRLGNRRSAYMFDLQSVDTYVVGAGSRLPGGGMYTVADESAIVPIPDWLVDWLEKNSVAEKKSSSNRDAHPVSPEFDFGFFADHYEMGGHFIGDWYVTDVCPVAGHKHENSTRTGWFFDGTSLGFHCFASGCAGNTMTAGKVVKFLNETHEPPPYLIWEEEAIENVLSSIGAEGWDDAEPREGKHGMTPEGEAEHERLEQEIRDKEAESEAYQKAQEKQREEKEKAPQSKHDKVIYSRQFEDHMGSITGHLASTVKPEPIRWIWKERFPAGKLALMNGAQGSGKTFLFIDLAARISSGADFPDCKNTLGARKVLLASTEDDENDTIIPRLMAAGADLDNVTILGKVQIDAMIKNVKKTKNVMLNLKEHTKLIKGLLKEHKDVALILLDPITAFFGCDETKDKEVRPVLESLAEVMSGTMATMIGIIHSNKMTKGSAGDKVKGGSSVLGVVRTAWSIGRYPKKEDVPDGLRYMALIKGNVLKKETGLSFTIENKVLNASTGLEAGYVVWGEQIQENANDLLNATRSHADEKVEPKDTKLESAKTMLQTELKNGWRLLSEIHRVREKLEIGETTLKRARQVLGIIYTPKGEGNCRIALPGTPSYKDAWVKQHEDNKIPDQDVL